MAQGASLGKAYVQIVPSAQGIKGSITKALSGESTEAGNKSGSLIGSGLVSKLKTALVAAGIGKIVLSALTEGGKLQQSIGGVETLYGEAADTMKQYASEAYRFGLSANDYMEQTTSFAAALKQSLGGDVTAAAEAANMAIQDMADNSAKFGTDVQSIQNAYQGFAKQNYTMLDNLKLGYGGTKTEMERLLKDASELSGIEYNIDNLDDVYEAIHVIQGELGLTGSAASEASETFSGSLASMKSALSNFLGNLTLGKDVEPALEALLESTGNFLFKNVLPMVGNLIRALPGAIKTLATTAMPQFVEQGMTMMQGLMEGMNLNIPAMMEQISLLMSQILNWIYLRLPEWIDTGFQWIQSAIAGIVQALPSIISTTGKVLTSMLGYMISHMPDFLAKGVELIANVAGGIWNNLPEILGAIAGVLGDVLSAIAMHFPDFLSKGWDLIKNMAQGLVKAIPDIVAKVPRIISSIIGALRGGVQDFVDMGYDLLSGLGRGIANAVGGVIKRAIDAVGNIVDDVKAFFGIASPSKLFASFGEYIDLGLAQGIEDNLRPVQQAMGALTDTASADFTAQLNAVSSPSRSAQTATGAWSVGGINITVNSAPGQNAEEIARAVSKQIQNEILKKKAVWA